MSTHQHADVPRRPTAVSPARPLAHSGGRGEAPTATLIRLSLALGATAGFALGLTLLGAVALGQTASLPWTALAQAHGQVQVLGFVGLFILGTASQLLPGFLARPLVRRRPILWGGWLLAVALLLRAIAQPFDPGMARAIALALSAIGEVGGVGLCLFSYAELQRHSIQPPDLWRSFAALGFGFLLVGVLLNVAAVASLLGGSAVVPASLDGALVEIELWGFVVFLAFGVSRKILPRFLLLPPPDDRLLRVGGAAYLIGVILVAAGSLVEGSPVTPTLARLPGIGGAWLRLGGVALYLIGLNLYRRPTRASGAPNVTEPARRWFQIAFAWLLVAAAIGAVWATRLALGGLPVGFFEQTAERHALAQGFIMLLIVAYAARVLPGFSAWAITHPRLIAAIVGCLTLGAGLRVIGEIGVSTLGLTAEAVAGVGGALGVAGFLLFAVPVARTIGHR